MLCKKYYVFSFIKLLTYSLPNTFFLFDRQQKIKKMVVFKEISDYFTKLVERLVATPRYEEMFGKLKEEIIERFDDKFTAQNQKIVDSEEKLLLKRKKLKI